jgi:hypothetical protein
MKVVELILDAQKMGTGIDAVSLVEDPAIEANFIALKKAKPVEIKFTTVDTKRRILLGPALIPNKPIYRHQELDGEMQEFYVYFSKGTVAQASQFFLMSGSQNNATVEHEFAVNGCSVVESWIKEDMEKDKSAMYGMMDPVGTWMIAMKIHNQDVWDEYVETGRVKGFSIEGYFANKATPVMIEQSAVKPNSDAHAVLNELRSILSEYQKSNS